MDPSSLSLCVFLSLPPPLKKIDSPWITPVSATIKDYFNCWQCPKLFFKTISFYLAVPCACWSHHSVFSTEDIASTKSVLEFSLLLHAEFQSQSMAHLCVVQEAIKGSFLWTGKGGGRVKNDHYSDESSALLNSSQIFDSTSPPHWNPSL